MEIKALTVSLAKANVAQQQLLMVVLTRLKLSGAKGVTDCGNDSIKGHQVEALEKHSCTNFKCMVFHKLEKCMELEANAELHYLE